MFEYLKDSLTNFYKEHTEKFINNKADELREEAMAEIKSLRQIVAITLLAIFGLLALAYFWPEPVVEATEPEEEEK